MGRTVRMIKCGWGHPKKDDGKYIPLYSSCFEEADKSWSEGYHNWQKGLRSDTKGGWKEIEYKYKNLRYCDWDCRRPDPDDYMPKWLKEEANMYVMYEDTSEGTPISPPFETPEELARWLVDNKASSFGSCTATYEQWLYVCKGGWSPSMVISDGRAQSGVEAMGDNSKQLRDYDT
jgi:hypothetical protein